MFLSWGTVLTEHSSYKQRTTARYHQLLHSTDCHDGRALCGHGVTTTDSWTHRGSTIHAGQNYLALPTAALRF